MAKTFSRKNAEGLLPLCITIYCNKRNEVIAIMNEYFLIKQRNMEEELACVDETAPIWKYYHQE